MGVATQFVDGRWRDKHGQYAPKPPPDSPLWSQVERKPPTTAASSAVPHLRALPPPPPEPTAAPPPPPPPPRPSARRKVGEEQSTEHPTNDEDEDLEDEDLGDDAAPAEEADDWTEEPTTTEEEAPPNATTETPGMSTADVLRELDAGLIYAMLVRLVALKMPPGLPAGTRPPRLFPGETARYEKALAAVADRYFPTIPAGELMVLGFTTVAGVRLVRSQMRPPTDVHPSDRPREDSDES